MFTLQYLTGDGWQWVTYDGMMPVGSNEVEMWKVLQTKGWAPMGTRGVQCLRTGQHYQCRVVILKPHGG